MADATMLARRQLRLAMLAALQRAQLGAAIECPGDWSTAPDILPAILLRVVRERKDSAARTLPVFTTTVTFELEAKLSALSAEEAQDAIEEFGYRIEQAILTDHDLVALCQQFVSIDTLIEVTAEGRAHLGGLKMTLELETFEAFDPIDGAPISVQPLAVPMTSMGIHADMGSPFDITGTYPDAAFPDAVSPAPRTSGPDGRDEGALDITLPQ